MFEDCRGCEVGASVCAAGRDWPGLGPLAVAVGPGLALVRCGDEEVCADCPGLAPLAVV